MSRWKRYPKSKLFYFLFISWFLVQFFVSKSKVCFLSVLLLLLLSTIRVFFSRLLIVFCNVFRSYPFSQNISARYSISAIKYFSEQILVALTRNFLNMLVILLESIQECGLICTFVRAGLRWTSNSYLPLFFFVFMSRKFKHFSSFSFSIVNWMCFSCLLKISLEIRETVLDIWIAHEYHQYIIYTFLEPYLRLMLLQWHCVPNSECNLSIKWSWKIIQ